MLHDIGRFQQYQIANKEVKFNHGEAGVEILKKDNFIRKFIAEETYDNLILTAVYEHNRYQLSQGLTKEQALFSKIIKDADKIDLLYEGAEIYWQQPEEIQEIEKGKLSPQMLEHIYQYQLADIKNRISRTDQILRFASYVFDINFPYSLKVLKENGDIIKMLDRFTYKDPKTKQEMEKIKEMITRYLDKKI